MHNSLYPGFVKLFYSVGTKEHTSILPCKPFLNALSAWWVENKGGGGGGLWTAAVDSYLAVIKAFYHSSASWTNAELWTLASAESDPIYREGYMPGVAGTAATSPTPMAQLVVSGRTQEGGVAKLYLMEPSLVVNQKLKPPYATTYAALATYMLGSTSWIVGRNGGFWIAVPQQTTKTNDTLRRQAGLE